MLTKNNAPNINFTAFYFIFLPPIRWLFPYFLFFLTVFLLVPLLLFFLSHFSNKNSHYFLLHLVRCGYSRDKHIYNILGPETPRAFYLIFHFSRFLLIAFQIFIANKIKKKIQSKQLTISLNIFSSNL